MHFLFGKKKKNEPRKTPERLAMEQKWAEDRIKKTPYPVKATQRIPEISDDAEVRAISLSMQIAYYGMYKHALALSRYFKQPMEPFTDSRAEFNYDMTDAMNLAYLNIVRSGNHLFLEPVIPGTKPECEGIEHLTLLNSDVGRWKPFEFKDSTGFVYRPIDPLNLSEDDFYYFRDVLLPYMVDMKIESPKYYESVMNSDLFNDWKMYEEGAFLSVSSVDSAIGYFRNKIISMPFRGSVPLFYRWGCGRAYDELGDEISTGGEDKKSLHYCTAYSVDDIANLMYQIAPQIPIGRFTEISSVGIPEYENLSLEEHDKVFACNLFTTIRAKCLEPKNDENGYPVQSGRVIDYYLEFITDSEHAQVRVGAPMEDYKNAVEQVLGGNERNGEMLWDSTYDGVFVGNDNPPVFEQIDDAIRESRAIQARILEEKAQELRDSSYDDY